MSRDIIHCPYNLDYTVKTSEKNPLKVNIKNSINLPVFYTCRIILEGILSYLPYLKNFGLKGKVITDYKLTARYYYSVWLRHLALAHKN